MNNNNDSNNINLTDISLNSYDDLVWLSYQSLGKISHCLSCNDKKILSQFIKLKYIQPILKNCSLNHLKLYLVYKTLNTEQKDVFLKIHNKMSSSKHSITCINSGPGTGKTFVIASLALTCRINPCYLVYTRRLENQLSKISNLHTYTNCKFIMDSLNLSFYQQKKVWGSKKINGEYMNMVEKFYEVLCLANRVKLPTESNLYILDEYSVVSPMFIFFLYCLSIRWNLHILFVGDKFQQSSINKSIFHTAGNFLLIQALCDDDQQSLLLLERKMRQDDDLLFQNKIELVTQILRENYIGNETPMNFAIKYSLYQIFKDHFMATETFSSTYLAQYHKDIKNRILRHQSTLKGDTSFKLAYVCTKSRDRVTGKEIFIERQNGWTSGKFLPYLLLVKGQTYNYIMNVYKQVIVKYLGFYVKDSTNKWVIVQDINDKRYYALKPKLISPETMHAEQIKWLKSCTYSTLYQYPLLPRCYTYHAAQGITIPEEIVELNMDTATLNSFYVGLTRLRKISQLGKMHSAELCDFILNEIYNDEYYFYKISSYNKLLIKKQLCSSSSTTIFDLLKALKFTETKNLHVFNKNEKITNYKISRYVFDNTIKQKHNLNRDLLINDNKLINLAKYIKTLENSKKLTMLEYSQEYLYEYLKEFA